MDIWEGNEFNFLNEEVKELTNKQVVYDLG